MKKPLLTFGTVLIFVLLLLGGVARSTSFKQEQMRYPRVRDAYQKKGAACKRLFCEKNFAYPPKQIFIRVFKKEKTLEVWNLFEPDATYHLMKKYPICGISGFPGPKRKEGDCQVPEGFYHIDRFNPESQFHLSLGINYPNASDAILGQPGNLGGNIFIHGGCATIGCIPMSDDWIKEIYVLCVEAKDNGQPHIPVHIFPMRLIDKPPETPRETPVQTPDTFGLKMIKLLTALMEYVNRIFSVDIFSDSLNSLRKRITPENQAPAPPELSPFWLNLKEGHDFFEHNRRLPDVSVNIDGTYQFMYSGKDSP